MNYFRDILHLFFPKLCITCNTQLLETEQLLCTLCRHDLPLICYKSYKDNKIAKSFAGKIQIENATALLFYRKTGKTKKLIHALKYKSGQEIGTMFGNWLGVTLKQAHQFDTIAFIIPVPLHPRKQKQRGYNQVTTFGLSLAKQLNKTYLPDVLIRISAAKTQTFKQRFERFNNSSTKFYLTDKHLLANKHILLIDDVITTGATLEACCKELFRAANVKISIATIAYTE
ncbi:MAG: ComF family protein [Flavobacteriaceae bacterium]|nr:ComF family protein [Flavobacteriaceae bacterium]